MHHWDDFDEKLATTSLAPEAGEWVVIAMACVAYADQETKESEIARAARLIEKSVVINRTLGVGQAKLLFDHELQALELNPAGELAFQKARLRELADSFVTQEDRDAACYALVAMATADHDVTIAEYELLKELRAVLRSQVMIPMPQVQC